MAPDMGSAGLFVVPPMAGVQDILKRSENIYSFFGVKGWSYQRILANHGKQ